MTIAARAKGRPILCTYGADTPGVWGPVVAILFGYWRHTNEVLGHSSCLGDSIGVNISANHPGKKGALRRVKPVTYGASANPQPRAGRGNTLTRELGPRRASGGEHAGPKKALLRQKQWLSCYAIPEGVIESNGRVTTSERHSPARPPVARGSDQPALSTETASSMMLSRMNTGGDAPGSLPQYPRGAFACLLLVL